MKRMIKYPKTQQYRQVIKAIKKLSPKTTTYKGQDEEGNPILEHTWDCPTYKVLGTEKIHGQNYAVCYNKIDGMWFQSRNNIVEVSPTSKYFKEEPWLKIINTLADEYKIDLTTHTITVYGEHCGGNIQKNSCMSGLSKRFVIFSDFKVSPTVPYEEKLAKDLKEGESFHLYGDTNTTLIATHWNEYNLMECDSIRISNKEAKVQVLSKEISTWYPTNNVNANEFDIYNVLDFPTVSFDLDFNKAAEYVDKLLDLTKEVEDNSGIAKAFNVPDNIGEGWVWSFYDKDGTRHIFKTKGEKHSKNAGKIKVLKPVDKEKEQKVVTFINDYGIKTFRLEQAWEEVFGVNNEKNEPSKAFTGDIINFVYTDTLAEESDILIELGLEAKDIKPLLSQQTRQWFFDKLDKEV